MNFRWPIERGTLPIMAVVSSPLAAQRTYQDELSRLLNAAVVSPAFRDLLLSYPERALANGYNYEPFQLPVEEQARILSIRASSLSDFAVKLLDVKNGKHADR